ncbi:MAG: hypothetical protein GY769_20445 [bacterium]|nr:hypothetical protein [bacterium]
MSRQEALDLRDGAGMGLARAAELNHYPGPLHVLELAEKLDLSGTQKDEIERFRSEMLSEAQRLGQKILEREEHLDRRFSHQHLDEPLLRELTAEIAELYGKLRFVHLRAHLQARAILSEAQVAAYDRHRGYDE